MAAFLDTFFYGFDHAILQGIHAFSVATHGAPTPLMLLITTLGDGGICFILFGVILLLFRRTRKVGVAVLLAIAIGGIITNLTLKPLVARVRPYEHEPLRTFWQYVGASLESERSFPSGHTTVSFAAMGAVFLSCRKKYSWPALVLASLVAFTRLYLMVHYPTDVIAGVLVGTAAAFGGFGIATLAYRVLRAHETHPVPRFILNADLLTPLRRLFPTRQKENEHTPNP